DEQTAVDQKERGAFTGGAASRRDSFHAHVGGGCVSRRKRPSRIRTNGERKDRRLQRRLDGDGGADVSAAAGVGALRNAAVVESVIDASGLVAAMVDERRRATSDAKLDGETHGRRLGPCAQADDAQRAPVDGEKFAM